jgi:hypothetical protein
MRHNRKEAKLNRIHHQPGSWETTPQWATPPANRGGNHFTAPWLHGQGSSREIPNCSQCHFAHASCWHVDSSRESAGAPLAANDCQATLELIAEQHLVAPIGETASCCAAVSVQDSTEWATKQDSTTNLDHVISEDAVAHICAQMAHEWML